MPFKHQPVQHTIAAVFLVGLAVRVALKLATGDAVFDDPGSGGAAHTAGFFVGETVGMALAGALLVALVAAPLAGLVWAGKRLSPRS